MRIRAGPQADAALFFFGRKERGYEPDQGKTVVTKLHIYYIERIIQKERICK